MGDPTASTLPPVAESRCPSCAATLRAGAPWCTLCYTDLRPAPEPEPAAAPAYAPSPPVPTDPGADSGAEPLATWPCTTCETPNPFTLSACATCGAGFLSRLRETEGPLLELPVVGDLGAMSRGRRLVVAVGFVLAAVVLMVLLALLLG